MTDEERKDKIRYAPQSVEIVVCEGCESAIDDAFFDSPFAAREFAEQHLRASARILCDRCADPTTLERRRERGRAAARRVHGAEAQP